MLLLHSESTIELVRAVQWHDLAERWTGDIPATAKWMSGTLNDSIKELEERILKHFGLKAWGLSVSDEEWLKAVDVLDAWLWCRENQTDRHVYQVKLTYEAYVRHLHEHNRFPAQAWLFFNDVLIEPVIALPDTLDGLSETR